MAPKAAEPAIKTAVVGTFTFDIGLPVPEAKRGPHKASEVNEKLRAMPVGASFLEAVTVADTIKDEDERKKVFAESTRSTMNRLSGATRRFKKTNADYDFELRTVNDDIQGRGVRVYRVPVLPTVTPAA